MDEYEKVREQIAKQLFTFKYPSLVSAPAEWEICVCKASQILALGIICIKANDQSLPEIPQHGLGSYSRFEVMDKCEIAQRNILEANFIRMVPKPI